MCDRLVRKGLIVRERQEGDRRAVQVSISAEGQRLVGVVTRRRRRDIQTIVRRVPASERERLVSALRTFADAAGEVPEQDWSLGWGAENA
jgi:DNA-binding MarR family transcriptional regulator